ncbi:nitrite reductase (NADH) small subunit [Mycetocola sp. CAN_C7]|uniref:nitrite reductase small subunit NirD n=1 Tax=Mycetocola sp. CAN_C7 TaxID=2787724 RepID=UPI0018C9707B
MTIAIDRDVRRTPVTTWESVCAVDELEPSWGEVALLKAQQIALFLLSPFEVYAVSHRDPHTEAHVMARGIVGSKGDRPTVASPLHKEVYDLATGECFSNPDFVLQTYRTRIVGGMIEVELS